MNLSAKIIKSYLSQLNSVQKKLHYSNFITKHKNIIRETWEVIKHSIEKTKRNKKNFPQKS